MRVAGGSSMTTASDCSALQNRTADPNGLGTATQDAIGTGFATALPPKQN
jgi:hypothetical protein